ncbi:MAG: helix-turn-helix transcriptional regulator [Clostridia bacterium]|nr:helix-turn-helix transcriptional regulator [Clostridia bacterium]
MSDLSCRILDLIGEKNMSYGELSKLTGIPKSALQRYAMGETEKIPVDRIKSIAKALNVTAIYLLGWEDEAQPARDNPFSSETYDLALLIDQLDVEDKAEIRGTVKQMLKADKYTIQKESRRA